MTQGWADLNLPDKTAIVSTAVFIAVAGLIAYATVRQLKTQRKIEKRMHLDDEDGGLA